MLQTTLRRDKPLFVVWRDLPSNVRAWAETADNTIAFNKSLKALSREEPGKIIEFEMLNLEQTSAFHNVEREVKTETKPRKPRYPHQIGEFKRADELDSKQLSIVKMERLEYLNLLKLYRLAQQEGKTTNYDALFTGGDRAPWASFYAYLLHQLKSGHYSHDDPSVVDGAAWRGLKFLKHEEYQALDPMTRPLPN